jgi:hypothetical protein
VKANLFTYRPILVTKYVHFRKLEANDKTTFRANRTAIIENIVKLDNLQDLVDEYDAKLHDLLNQHAPVKCKKITLRPEVPWFSNEALKLKTEVRQAERHWVKNKTLRTGLNFVDGVTCTRGTWIIQNVSLFRKK